MRFVATLSLYAFLGTLLSTATAITIPWHSSLQPVFLGSGVQMDTAQITPLGVSVDATGVKWQNKVTSYQLLDYTSLTSTLTKFHFNAWAEAKFRLGGGSFSFDASYLRTFDGNHRRWQVDATMQNTATISKPKLNADSLKYASNPTAFQSFFGNYAVTGIRYQRAIHILFDLTFSRSYSETEFQATINASYKWIKGGASASELLSQLNQWTSLTISAEVEGQGGPIIIAVANTGNLDDLRKAVSDQLVKWDGTPPDPNDAGNIYDVYLTPYTSIPPGIVVNSGQSPAQANLISAMATLAKLELAATRLHQIQDEDAYIYEKDPVTKAYIYGRAIGYLFGKTKNGVHVDGTGKLDEVSLKMDKQYAYVVDLVNGVPTKDPKVSFSFDDPDVVKWRVLQAMWNPNGANSIIYIEIYSSTIVTPTTASPSDTANWGVNVYLNMPVVNNFYQPNTPITGDVSYRSNLDPVTGIPHRYAVLYYDHPAQHTDFSLQLTTDGGGWHTNAINWSGWPTPLLFIPGGQFIPLP
ncbi:MAG: hypothetical protein NT023_11815 [Armatimonadetes bacterium]|nr:hypothetical protein [Armatimonadota bacterium]